MRPRDKNLAARLNSALLQFSQRQPLPGIRTQKSRVALIEQLLESIHRVRYIAVISKRDISPLRSNPSSDLFDPIKGAILMMRQGNIDEAFWLVFLSVHFGRHLRTGWRRSRDVYGGLGQDGPWDWNRISHNPLAFRQWLAANERKIGGHFGNHRKYESLKTRSRRGTAAVVESYINWVRPPRTHVDIMNDALAQSNGNSRAAFEILYQSLDQVISFGRMARFDYLTMVGKLRLAQIEPGSVYLQDATGPVRGARLLVGGAVDAKIHERDLDVILVRLGDALNIGMQVVEDALCNWQKNPERFVPFRG